jgi:hypothetical protein
MEHLSCYPDLVPNDFWLSALKGRKYQDIEDIKKLTALKAIPQQEFQNCFQQWQYRWAKCIAAQG